MQFVAAAVAVCLLGIAGMIVWRKLHPADPYSVASVPEENEARRAATAPGAPGQPVSPDGAKPGSPAAAAAPAAPAAPTSPVPRAPKEGGNLVSLVDRIDDAVVLISTQDESGNPVGLGSGFLVEPGGLVATNMHVIRNTSAAFAQFRDGTKVEVAGCRAFDKETDLALLELRGKPPRAETLKLAESAAPAQGATVIAVGHPSGFKFAVSTGIVSAVHKTSELPEVYQQLVSGRPDQVWIQTTAAISSGNSGGPLLLESGEVVGINTWVAAGENLGFASHVRHLSELLKKLKPAAVALGEMNKKGQQLNFVKNMDPQVLRVFQEYLGAQRNLVEQLQEASTPEQARSLLVNNNIQEKYLGELTRLAERNPGGPVAMQSHLLVYKIASAARHDSVKPFVEKSSAAILRDHVDDKSLFGALFLLADESSRRAVEFLRQIAEKSSVRANQGAATLLAAVVMNQDEGRRRRRKAEILGLLEKVEGQFADVPLDDEETLGGLAKNLRFELEHLSLGAVAPDLVAKDGSGNEIRLSALRGKVVVIDFFADWCPYCRRMYPEERQLVVDMAGKPFALVGVNCERPERLRALVENKTVTWPSIPDGANGPIAKEWRVDSFPTIFVLDGKGVIRRRFSGDPGTELRRSIESLLAESDGKKPATKTIDLDAELAKLKESLVAESAIVVVGKAIDLLAKNKGAMKSEHIKLVEGWFRSAVKQDPKAAYVPLFRAQLYVLKDEHTPAIKSLREALKRPEIMGPPRAAAQNTLAYLLSFQRDKKEELAEARTLIEHSLATAGPRPAILDTQALVLWASGKPEDAQEILETAVGGDPNPLYLFHLALVEASLDDMEGAATTLQLAKESGFEPNNLPAKEKKLYQKYFGGDKDAEG